MKIMSLDRNAPISNEIKNQDAVWKIRMAGDLMLFGLASLINFAVSR